MTSNFRFYAIFAPFWFVLSRISWLCTFLVNDICRWQMEQHYHRTNKTIGSQPSIDSWFSLVFPLSWHLKKSLVNKLSLALKKVFPFTIFAQCLKIPKKVSFDFASEVSYVYILSGQKFIKNAKNGRFWRVFHNLMLEVRKCYQTGQF